jgi:hypothetical protein
MLSKRIFWLTCAAIVSWLIWMRLRQRHDDFAASTPQFAPPRTFTPYTPTTPPAPQPKLDEAAVASATTLPVANDVTAASPPAPATTSLPDSAATADISADESESNAIAEADIEISGYCMRCKTKRPIQNAHRETTESGRPAARGTCPICGANMFTFLSTDDA